VTPEAESTIDGESTIDAAIAHALDAYASLVELAEEIEDEWTYVDDLSTTWRDRLEEVAATRHGVPVGDVVRTAIDQGALEAGRITDPHRAIDWLSTFPQVVLVALGERP
jgi:hypothetical protein